MSTNNLQHQMPVYPQDEPPVYTFLSEEPAEVFNELADMHHREAKQLLERAHEAEAEGRQEEAKLLMDVSAFRQERAEELERTARGEVEDPSVVEVLDGQQDILNHYTPHTYTFVSPDELPPATVPEHMRPREPGRFDRAWAKVTHWWNQ
jgi:hypothetical protein